MLNPDKNTIEWVAQWIEDSLKAETNERTIEFGKNMAMTFRSLLLDFRADLRPTGDAGCEQSTINEILAERQRQDEQWGGQQHDDEHAAYEWFEYEYIWKQWSYGRDASNKLSTIPDARARLVKIAALAVAGIESIDRRYAPPEGKESK